MRYEFEGTSLDTLREMVVMGLGVTFLPGLYVQREIIGDPNLRTLELKGRSIYRTVGMVWRKKSALHAVYGELAVFFKTSIQNQITGLGVLR